MHGRLEHHTDRLTIEWLIKNELTYPCIAECTCITAIKCSFSSTKRKDAYCSRECIIIEITISWDRINRCLNSLDTCSFYKDGSCIAGSIVEMNISASIICKGDSSTQYICSAISIDIIKNNSTALIIAKWSECGSSSNRSDDKCVIISSQICQIASKIFSISRQLRLKDDSPYMRALTAVATCHIRRREIDPRIIESDYSCLIIRRINGSAARIIPSILDQDIKSGYIRRISIHSPSSSKFNDRPTKYSSIISSDISSRDSDCPSDDSISRPVDLRICNVFTSDIFYSTSQISEYINIIIEINYTA